MKYLYIVPLRHNNLCNLHSFIRSGVSKQFSLQLQPPFLPVNTSEGNYHSQTQTHSAAASPWSAGLIISGTVMIYLLISKL